jgi:hypothetical protein
MLQKKSSPASDERRKLLKEIKETVPEAEAWLKAQNDQFAGQTPQQFLDGNSKQRKYLRDLIRAIQHGMPT